MLTVDDLSREGYDTVVIATPDVQGRLFGRRIPARRFLEDPQDDLPICTCALVWDITEDLAQEVPFAGYHTGWNDFILKPELATLRPYPGVPGTAIVMADVLDEEGEPLEVAPRTVLRRQVERAAAAGYELRVASEIEFYLFHGSIREARQRAFRDLEPTTMVRSDYSIVGQAVQEPFIARIRREMDAADIPVYACQAEYGLGQWEVNLEYAGLLEMADRHAIYKAGVKEMALQEGLAVTFMARPVDDMGSSCHFHTSLWREGRPLFPVERSAHHLSSVGRHFLGGLLHRLDETALLLAPYVNSYKRHNTEDFGGGIEAWGFDNRTVALRVVGKGPTLRIEHRYAGADVNPYLGLAAVTAAGLDGVERETDPGQPFVGNAYQDEGLRRTHRSLAAAVEAFEGSDFIHSAFGKEVVTHYAAHGRGEWEGYLKAVTDWEVMRAFELA
jgi:glutamine synthetase